MECAFLLELAFASGGIKSYVTTQIVTRQFLDRGHNKAIEAKLTKKIRIVCLQHDCSYVFNTFLPLRRHNSMGRLNVGWADELDSTTWRRDDDDNTHDATHDKCGNQNLLPNMVLYENTSAHRSTRRFSDWRGQYLDNFPKMCVR